MHNRIVKEFFLANNFKAKNLKQIYKEILRESSISVDKIIDKTHIKPATCARLLDELVQSNLILANQLGKSTGGRRPILYSVNPTIGYLIGIEITGIFSTILLMNIELSIIDKIKLKTNDSKINPHLLDLIIDNIHKILANNKIILDDILGIGISSDDLLNQYDLDKKNETNEVIDIKSYLNRRLPIYLTLGSGTNFAAIAEHKLHYVHCSKRFVFTSCDIEIRSSTIINHTIPLTQASMTDSFGHMTIDKNGSICACGSKGCLQQYSALPAIKEKIIKKISNGDSSIINKWASLPTDIDYHTIFKAFEHNDSLALSVLEEAAYDYSIGLFNLILSFQPDTVICGGTLVPKGSFFKIIKKHIEDKLKHYPQLCTKIYPASASYDIVSQGAGAMVLEQFLK
ncbi:ROK family protein [Orbus sturtevantii]|uniref:ROK family protein n=1 Tax=Orbus sturtevantii TaxID=3074109 RepID=UPI00370D6D13